MGERVFTMVQYGVEGTKGTAVPATAKWPGTVKVPTDRKPKFPRYATGRRSGAITSRIDQYLVDGMTLSMDEGVYEYLPVLFNMLMVGATTAGTGKWQYKPTLTTAGVYDTTTIEFGDDTEQYEVEYCMCRRVRNSGRTGADEPVKVEAELFGRQITVTSFTAAQTLKATLTPMIANMATFSIDTTWAGLGGTAKTGLLREWDIEILNGLHPKFFANGTMTFGGYGEGDLAVLATFVYEGNADADAEYDAFAAQTSRAMRLLIGDATNGLQIDMFGRYEEIIPLASESDGNNLHTAVFHGMDDNQATPHIVEVIVNTPSTTL
jgi:hypothetical protein